MDIEEIHVRSAALTSDAPRHHCAVLERTDIWFYFVVLLATVRGSPDRLGSHTHPGAATPVDLFGKLRY